MLLPGMRSPLSKLIQAAVRPAKTRQQLCSRPQYSNRRFVATHPYAHHAAAISVVPTAVDTSNPEFKENAAEIATVIASLKQLHAKIERGGPKKARDKHIARGKMLPRE